MAKMSFSDVLLHNVDVQARRLGTMTPSVSAVMEIATLAGGRFTDKNNQVDAKGLSLYICLIAKATKRTDKVVGDQAYYATQYAYARRNCASVKPKIELPTKLNDLVKKWLLSQGIVA